MTVTRSVLIVDDDGINRLVLRRIITAAGFTPQEAANGAEGVTATLQGTHALVLMDVMMPVLDGLEAVRRIRALERDSGRTTPIIAVTALTDTTTRQACMAAGVDFYVPKPLETEALRQALTTWVLPSPPPLVAIGDPATALDIPRGSRPASLIPDLLDALDRLLARTTPSTVGSLRSLLVGLGARRALAALDALAPLTTPPASSDAAQVLAREIRMALVAATTPCPA